MRQECPLSPVIFALTLEPLLNKVHLNPNIKELCVGRVEHILSAYADDVLFYASDPLLSLPNIITELWDFNLISNLKINYDKLKILPLSISPDLRTGLQFSFSFTWCHTSLKYLGIHLPPHCSQLHNCNYSPLISTIRADLQKWERVTFS